MSVSLKRLALRLFIALVRGAAITIYYAKRIVRALAAPLAPVAKVLLRTVGVPVYRAMFSFDGSWAISRKKQVMYVLTNRYAIHGGCHLGVTTATMSVQASGCAPTTLGEQRALSLVTGQENTSCSCERTR